MLYVVVQPCLILGDPTDCSTPGLPVLHHPPELAHTHVCCVSDAIHPVLSSVASFSSCPQSFPVFPQYFPVFSNELALCIRWPKYWSFSIIPSHEYSGLISFLIWRHICSELLPIFKLDCLLSIR